MANGRQRGVSALKRLLGGIPIVGRFARNVYHLLVSFSGPEGLFPGSEGYWKQRYAAGGDSGVGSAGKLAEFKAEITNRFVRENGITSVVEYGCGDGNQLKSADYPMYLGFDVSPSAISQCRALFRSDPSKSFRLMSEYAGERADLGLSLDVVYHLVEDFVFEEYMHRLFDSADRFVIIYSSNTDENLEDQAPHVRHRAFTNWIEQNLPEWVLERQIPNRFPYRGDDREGTIADFFIYRRAARGRSL